MPRRSRPREEPGAGPNQRFGPRTGDTTESAADGDWTVRAITGAASTRTYRCPGCDQEIRPATPHLVVWPMHDLDAADRRHWHRACWGSRGRRNPGRSRW